MTPASSFQAMVPKECFEPQLIYFKLGFLSFQQLSKITIQAISDFHLGIIDTCEVHTGLYN